MAYDRLKPEQIFNLLEYLPIVTKTLVLDLDGSGEPLTTGLKGYIIFPYNAEIISWHLVSDTIGSCQIDIWKSSGIPNAGNSITGNIKPSLSSQQNNSDNILSGWTIEIIENDIIAFNIISTDIITKLNLVVKLKLI